VCRCRSRGWKLRGAYRKIPRECDGPELAMAPVQELRLDDRSRGIAVIDTAKLNDGNGSIARFNDRC